MLANAVELAGGEARVDDYRAGVERAGREQRCDRARWNSRRRSSPGRRAARPRQPTSRNRRRSRLRALPRLMLRGPSRIAMPSGVSVAQRLGSASMRCREPAIGRPPASFPRRRESSVCSSQRRWVPAFAGTTTLEMGASVISVASPRGRSSDPRSAGAITSYESSAALSRRARVARQWRGEGGLEP